MSAYYDEPSSPTYDTFDLFDKSPPWSPARDEDEVEEGGELVMDVDHLDVEEILREVEPPRAPSPEKARLAATPTIKKKRAPKGSRAPKNVVFVPVPVHDHTAFALWPFSVANVKPIAPKPPPAPAVKSYADFMVPGPVYKIFEEANISSGVIEIVSNFIKPTRYHANPSFCCGVH
jgi:hypothetical protein